MTPEEQQKEQERLATLRAEFDQKMVERQQRDAQQMPQIGRDYSGKLPDAKTLDDDFKADARKLQEQNENESQGFKTWLHQQRDALRANDAQQPGKVAPRYAPTFALGQSNSYGAPSRTVVANFAEKEAGRQQFADRMEKQFDSYQVQTNAARFDALNAKLYENTIGREGQQEPPQQPKKYTFENEAEHAARQEAIQNAEVQRVEHARDNGTDSVFTEGLKKQSFESDMQHEKRMVDALEYAKQQQEHERAKTITR